MASLPPGLGNSRESARKPRAACRAAAAFNTKHRSLPSSCHSQPPPDAGAIGSQAWLWIVPQLPQNLPQLLDRFLLLLDLFLIRSPVALVEGFRYYLPQKLSLVRRRKA